MDFNNATEKYKNLSLHPIEPRQVISSARILSTTERREKLLCAYNRVLCILFTPV